MHSKELRIDIDVWAAALNFRLNDFLLPAQLGIYISGHDKPVITPETKNYFGLIIKKGRVADQYQVVTIDDIRGAVYDDSFEMVISKEMGQNKNDYLSYAPTVPVRGRELIASYYSDFVFSREKMNPRLKNYNLHVAHEVMMNGISFEDLQDVITDLCSELTSKIAHFVPLGTWMTHCVECVDSDLIITRVEDARIIDWEEKHGADFSGGCMSELEA